MNATKVQQIINEVIEENRKRITLDYTPAKKAQIDTLTELGIIGMMPARFSWYDARVVIAEAKEDNSPLHVAIYGEGHVSETIISDSEHEKFSHIFGNDQSGDDVSLESALAASKMPAKQTVKTQVYDTELGWVEEWVTVDATATDEILEAVDAYQEDRLNPDNLDLQYEYIKSMNTDSDGKVDREKVKAKFAALKAQIAKGKSYYEQGYRVKQTDRIVEGHAVDFAEANSLAERKVWSGHLATSPTYRWQYLVKR